jgi:hypothetical protein
VLVHQAAARSIAQQDRQLPVHAPFHVAVQSVVVLGGELASNVLIVRGVGLQS